MAAPAALGVEFLRGVNPAFLTAVQERSNNAVANSSGTHALRNPLSDRSELEALLRSCDGNISEAARRLNTTRAQVYRWIERFGLEVSRGRSDPTLRRRGD
jgi:transcriptional regulator with GAF, ATPase, and Fis domain